MVRCSRFSFFTFVALLAFSAFPAANASAQLNGSIGGGVAVPTGDFGDLVDTGFTIRAQGRWSIPLFGLHLQGGWSRFAIKEQGAGIDSSDGDFDIYHAGLGARFGLDLIWLGANASYFWSDGEDGLGFVPEVGLSLWRAELVADYRVDGDENWAGVRAMFRF